MPCSARITDMEVCPIHKLGIIITGMPTVIVGHMPVSRVSDQIACAGAVDVIVQGSSTVIIGGQMAARIGDSTAHSGVIVTGEPTVIIGG